MVLSSGIRRLSGAFSFFLLKEIVDLFSASSCEALMLAQVSTVLSARMLVRETITPPSHQAFQNFLLAAFEMTKSFLVLVLSPTLVQITCDFPEMRFK